LVVQWLGSIAFTLFFLVGTLTCGILFFPLCLVLPFNQRWKLAHHYARLVLWVLKVTCRLDYRLVGRDQLPPGAHVALWKHSSSWETVAMMALFPQQVWVLKRELIWIPFVGWTLALMKSIAINRSAGPSAVNQVIAQGKDRLARGSWVIIFPEGTRLPPGETRRYGSSGALLASQAGCLVVPVAHDAGYYWPRRGLLKSPGTIDVVIGPPIQAAGRDAREINAEVQDWIERTVTEIRARKAPDSIANRKP
jgi:1-acyl-sn-glycerol-3-phosphate acyltransferase